MKSILITYLFLFCFLLTGKAQTQQEVSYFPLQDVKLLESPFLQAQQTDLHYIMAMEPDRLLAPFLREAGLTPKAPSYTNWENTGLDGHIGGHYISALSMMYAATGDTAIYNRLNYMLAELHRAQQAVGTGFIGGTPGSLQLWKEIKAGNIRAGGFDLNGKWVPLYNIHKTYAGLRDAYLYAGSNLAREMLIALTDWMIDITAGLTDLWRETWVFFNVADAEASYPFADALFNEIVDRSGDDVLQMDAYDLVSAALAEEAGEVYDYDRAHIAAHGFPVIEREDRDTSEFRNYWLYMPQFRVLDQNDFVTTMAVFLVLFIFIALICFAAVIVIAFTRCMTIALTNARVYDDLRHLGAPNRYLFRSVKGQVSKVFLVPAIVGTAVISAFYLMIMYFNDNRFTPGEMAGMAVCAAVIAVLSAVLYGVYRITRRSVCRALGIQGK